MQSSHASNELNLICFEIPRSSKVKARKQIQDLWKTHPIRLNHHFNFECNYIRKCVERETKNGQYETLNSKTIQMLISYITVDTYGIQNQTQPRQFFAPSYALLHFNFSPRNFALININVNAYHRQQELSASAFIFSHLSFAETQFGEREKNCFNKKKKKRTRTGGKK